MATRVEVRGALGDGLHDVVRAGLGDLRRALDEHDRRLPGHVEREVERFLVCGDPARGFAWLVCDGCDEHRLVPFSCKGRAFCPACGGRRMAERAARWVDGLFPYVAVRQWVLTVPFRRRWLLARRPELAGGVLKVALREVTRWLRATSGLARGRSGSVTAVQRFGSALNLNLHFHVLALDGLYFEHDRGGLTFRRVQPRQADVDALVADIARAAEAWLAEQGHGEDEPDEPPDDDDAQAVLQAASLGGTVATGPRAGKRVRHVQLFAGREVPMPPLCAGCDGYTLHAATVTAARDRHGLERLCRYVLRPPLARSRFERNDDGSVTVGLKRVFADGTAELRLSPLELTERLCALVPPPYKNQVLYHGVFAARSAWRKAVVPKPRPPPPERAKKLARAARVRVSSRHLSWAELLAREFSVDGWRCPTCQQQMRLRCLVVRPTAATRVLATLAARAPP